LAWTKSRPEVPPSGVSPVSTHWVLGTVEASIAVAAVGVFVAKIPEPHSRFLMQVVRSKEESHYVDNAGSDVVDPDVQSRGLPGVRTLGRSPANLMNGTIL